METIGSLKKVDGRYEFRCEELGLCVRGDYAEWVVISAGEMMSVLAQKEFEGRLSEVEALFEFGEMSEIDVDSVKFEMKERFDILPQCLVTIGRMDYRWVAKEARQKLVSEFDNNPLRRVQDMSMTRNDSFLVNENGVDTSTKQ